MWGFDKGWRYGGFARGSKQNQCRDRQAVHRTYFALTPAGGSWQQYFDRQLVFLPATTSRGQTRLQKWDTQGTLAFPVFVNCSVPSCVASVPQATNEATSSYAASVPQSPNETTTLRPTPIPQAPNEAPP